MRRLEVPPIVFIGCIGPIVLCVLVIALTTFALFKPHLTLFYGDELQAVLENYERVRSAVFRKELPVSSLEWVATGNQLEWLQEQYQTRASDYLQSADPIQITRIRAYIDSCAVVLLDHYHEIIEIAFTLRKINDVWKVERQVLGYKAGQGGALFLHIC